MNAFLALGLMPVSSFLYPLKMKSGSRSTNRETGQCADNIVEFKKSFMIIIRVIIASVVTTVESRTTITIIMVMIIAALITQINQNINQ